MNLVTDDCHKPWMKKQNPIILGEFLLMSDTAPLFSPLRLYEDTLRWRRHCTFPNKDQLVTVNSTARREKKFSKISGNHQDPVSVVQHTLISPTPQ